MSSTVRTSSTQAVGPSSNRLSRELLRWIQSLDLAYSVKNVKRDFANGFLIAEILSRYFDKDISMHSYDNGIGSKVKKDNWMQLTKFLKRVPGLDEVVEQDVIDAIMNAENGAAVGFLNRLYSKLTRREVQEVHPKCMSGDPEDPDAENQEQDIPPYAKPTGSTLIREKMRSSEVVESKDHDDVLRKMGELNTAHDEALQLERLTDPDRFSTTDRHPTKILRGSTRPVGQDTPERTKVTVKEVQVKALNEKNLAHLRATRQAKDSPVDSVSSVGAPGSMSPTRNATISVDNAPMRHVMELLNEFVKAKLSETVLRHFDQQKQLFPCFVEMTCEGLVLSEKEIETVLEGLVNEAEVLASTCLEYPKDFWTLSGLLFTIISDCPEDKGAFASTINAFAAFGEECVKQDIARASLLLTDFSMAKIAHLISTSPPKRHGVLRIMYSFALDDVVSHMQMIKRLREHIADIPTFIHALSILVFMEHEMDPTLLDLYHYYCIIGMDHACTSLRAASIAMLVAFLPFDTSLVCSSLGRLRQFSQRNAWWEVKAQLLIVSSAVLSEVPEDEGNEKAKEAIAYAIDIILREFSTRAARNLRKLGLSYLAKNLAQYPELVGVYVDVLFTLPLAEAAILLTSQANDTDPVEELPLVGTSGGKYRLSACPNTWDSIAVARQVYFDKYADQDELPEPEQAKALQVFKACFEQLAKTDRDRIVELFDDVKGILVQSLGIPSLCGFGVEILACISFYASMDVNVLENPALLRICSALASPVDGDEASPSEDPRQFQIVRMLREISTCSARHASYTRSFLEEFKKIATTFEGSLFDMFYRELNQQ